MLLDEFFVLFCFLEQVINEQWFFTDKHFVNIEWYTPPHSKVFIAILDSWYLIQGKGLYLHYLTY